MDLEQPLVATKKVEPRMLTNLHEYDWPQKSARNAEKYYSILFSVRLVSLW